MATPSKSANTQVILNGKQGLQPPTNLSDLGILATFDNQTQASITTDELEFILDAYTEIVDYINNGLSGGFGIFEPMPITIQAVSNTQNVAAFEGGLRVVEALVDNERGAIRASLDRNNALNTLNERLEGVTWLGLESEGFVTDADYEDLDYKVVPIDQSIEIIITSLTLALVIKNGIDVIKDAQNAIGTISGIASSSATGTIGATVFAVIEAAATIAAAAAYVVLFVRLVSDLINLLGIIRRTHKVISVRRSYEIIASYLGYGFNTTITEINDDTIVFLPSNINTDQRNALTGIIDIPRGTQKGIPNASDYGYLATEWLAMWADMFNGRYQLVNNTIEFHSENSSYWIKQSTYIFPDILEPPFKYNTDELNASQLIRFSTDSQEQYTYENYEGTIFQVITNSQAVGPLGRSNIRGLKEISLPLALGTRSQALTAIENILLDVAVFVDDVINSLGGTSDLQNQVEQIGGVLVVSKNNHAVPKVLVRNANGIPLNARDVFNARTLYNNYHSYDSFISDNYRRQRKVYEGIQIPFGINDFVQLIDNSYFKTIEGKIGKFTKIEWRFDQDIAIADYWIEEVYTKNLEEITVFPSDG